MIRKKKFSKEEISWILYDVANSAFIMILTATIPIYFRSLAEDAGVLEHATSLWGTVTSVSVLILALLSPLIGALADYKGFKKRIFGFFLVIGLLGAVAFTFVDDWRFFLLFCLIARLGYSACNMLYDAMLTDVSMDERMDMVSSVGYAMGYIGSCIPFATGIIIIMTLPFGMDTVTAMKVSFIITIVWWIVFSLPLFLNVKQVNGIDPRPDYVKHSFSRLANTFKVIKKDKELLYYIIGYFLFIDGVYTIISMATSYGSEVGIDASSLVLALLLTQIIAFPCAILAGVFADKFGTEKLITFFIIMYVFICFWGFNLSEAWEFWVLAILVGLCQGGIQALSRSYFGKMIPKDEASEYFGLFDIFGRFADFLGPLFVAGSSFLIGSSRYGILSLIVLFIAGLYFFRLSIINGRKK